MPSAIVCSVPAFGHVRPMLAVTSALISRGWRVRFVTGKPFAEAVQATGAEFVPLTPDYDEVLKPPANGRQSMNHVKEIFFAAVPAQVRLLRALLAEEPADAVISELTFLGMRALLSDPPERRPALVYCSVFPLMLSSRDTAPFGPGLPPPTSAAQRRRYRALTWFTKNVALRPVHRATDRVFKAIGAPARKGRFFLDLPADVDLLAEFSVPAFEYPRMDAPPSLRFVGPPASGLPSLGELPEWWDELDDRPIVHLTQGTAFNDQPERLTAPTISALADRPVQVVVATGGRPVSELGPLPRNTFAAEYLPYDRLLERTSVLVTNGGFGTVTDALRHGVPIVIGSGFGDQVETAARVAWSGAGINLGKQIPTERAIAEAVEQVLADPSYRNAAAEISAEMRAAPGVDGLAREIEDLIARKPSSSTAHPDVEREETSGRPRDFRMQGGEPRL